MKLIGTFSILSFSSNKALHPLFIIRIKFSTVSGSNNSRINSLGDIPRIN